MEARDVLPTVIETLRRAGFAVSRNKIRIMGQGSRRVLNGVLLGRFPTVLPERISQLRSGIHKLRTGQVLEAQMGDYVRQLSSSIAQVGSINAEKALRLRADFDDARRSLRPRGKR